VNATSAAAAPAAVIRPAAGDTDFGLARELFEEYAQSIGVDLCFQGFAKELKTLPGAYAPPQGCLLLAGSPGRAFACIALRPLPAGAWLSPDGMIGEVKRLYVRPGHRGEGWGDRLARAVIAHAGASGYRELRLDTLESMKPARSLYASLGFRECEPYYHNPLSGVVYMRLVL
jgi:ribosomal protein S18 acetylase RimI-like enzyme